MVAELDYTEIAEVITQGLHEFLDELQLRLNEVGAALHDSFFAPQLAPGGNRFKTLIE